MVANTLFDSVCADDRRRDTQNALLRRGERDEYHIVLILAAGGVALRGQDPNHRHRHIFHQHGGADRVGEFAKQVGQHGLAQQAHDSAVMIVLIGEACGPPSPASDELTDSLARCLERWCSSSGCR